MLAAPDGVEVPGEVEVDVLHGDHLGIAASGGPALHAEHRPQGRLPQGGHGVFADFPQAVRQAHGGGGFPLPGGVGVMAVTKMSLPSGRWACSRSRR